MGKIRKRSYKSLVRRRQAGDTSLRIVEATRQLLQSEGYAGMTIEAIAELAKLEQQRECLRYERQEAMIISLCDAGRLRSGLDHETARDIFWMLTGRDVYRMLVRERAWSPQKYQDWLADTLVHSLLTPGRLDPARRRAVKSDSTLGPGLKKSPEVPAVPRRPWGDGQLFASPLASGENRAETPTGIPKHLNLTFRCVTVPGSRDPSCLVAVLWRIPQDFA